jgi:enediyne biosynthesis protein E4
MDTKNEQPKAFAIPPWTDPRWPFAALLTSYGILGFAVFGFSRTPWQMLFIVVSGAALDTALTWVLHKRKVFPLSAWISCCSLAILLNYSKGSFTLFLPVLLCIGSKHLLTLNGRHALNPSMFGVAVSLLIGGDVITAAPAYQWAGSDHLISLIIVGGALVFFLTRVNRVVLVLAFLTFYLINTGIRAVIMQHHIPPEMLFIGTLTTPPFFLFTFYMITDPQTSPKTWQQQILVAGLLAFVDLMLHLKESVFTFFYAALLVGSTRFIIAHIQKMRSQGFAAWREQEWGTARLHAALAVGLVAVIYVGVLMQHREQPLNRAPGFTLRDLPASSIGLDTEMGTLLTEVDPRVLHVAKWVLSVGDAVAVADVDNDGSSDLFLTNLMKRPEDRCALYRNVTDVSVVRFERVPLPALDAFVSSPKNGLCSGPTFADIDGDGDQDLMIGVGYGKNILLQNQLTQTGALSFVDISHEAGIDDPSMSLHTLFVDVDNDADLDLLVLHAVAPVLPGYETETPLNVFDLPQPQYTGDRRALHFMHDGWHNADNGGGNQLYLNIDGVHFQKQDSAAWGLTSHRWSLVASTSDFNDDGYVDIYVANDFGPDELFLNRDGKSFQKIVGKMFNDVGNDTYKGMNATIADVDHDGHGDVYISNVHHKLQAEGSMLWMVHPDPKNPFVPDFHDEATERGILNERRFAWGAAAGDLDLDGWVDIVQANGMLDDRLDRSIPDGQRKDYWYVNQKLMQSGPEVHTYADMWGDVRGRTLYGPEQRRIYLNRGAESPGYFADVAADVGMTAPNNSRGVALFDADQDGDLDVLITNQHDKVTFMLNDKNPQNQNHFVQLDLRAKGKNRDAVGAKVTVRAGDLVQTEEVRTTSGFAAARDRRIVLGLGAYAGAVSVDVTWPNGEKSHHDVGADARAELAQP